jgi:hypothetical protein
MPDHASLSHEDFIDEKNITVASVLSLQSTGIYRTEFDTPPPDRFSGYSDSSLRQKIFDIPVTQVEPVVEPDGVGNDSGRKSMALVCIHRLIIPISAN